MWTLATIAAIIATASARLQPRDICTVQSLADPLVDDGPAINAALLACGDTGRIVLSANQTYTLRSPVDLSPCRACEFQINGLVQISPDWDYWEKQTAVFRIANITAAIIQSTGTTATIDAQNFGWGGEPEKLYKVPPLFSVTQESYQIHVRNLKIINAPGAAFKIQGKANAVRLYGNEIGSDISANEGVVVEDARHVYLWNNTIRAASACVRILPNAENVQVEDTICISQNTSDTIPSGIELNFGIHAGLSWIRNVLVKKFVARGRMNVVAFLSPSDGEEGRSIEITNATFTDFTISGPAKRAVLLSQGNAALNATLIMFSKIKGKVEEEDQEGVKCKNEEDVCDFRVLDCRRGRVGGNGNSVIMQNLSQVAM